MKKVLIQLILISCIQILMAQQRSIHVQFIIIDNEYRDTYPNSINRIENECTEFIIDLLNNSFPFFVFTDEPVDDSLIIQIAESENMSTTFLKKTNFRISLRILDQSIKIEPYLIPFYNSADEVSGLPATANGFIENINVRFNDGLTNEKENLIKHIFSYVPLTRDVHWIENRSLWTIPISHDVSCIAPDSKIIVKLKIIDPIYDRTFIDTTLVFTFIKDIRLAQQELHLPVNYPDKSLLAQPKKSVPVLGSDNIVKRTYLVEYKEALQGIRMRDPDNQ